PGLDLLPEPRRRRQQPAPELLQRAAYAHSRGHPATQTRRGIRRRMKALLLTNEYPPHIYGGAGVHVEFLSRELAELMDVEVRCFGDQRVDDGRLKVRGYPDPSGMTAPDYLKPVFGAMARNLAWAGTATEADVVHCHTWYSHL